MSSNLSTLPSPIASRIRVLLVPPIALALTISVAILHLFLFLSFFLSLPLCRLLVSPYFYRLYLSSTDIDPLPLKP